jgi:hypothetical protein
MSYVLFYLFLTCLFVVILVLQYMEENTLNGKKENDKYIEQEKNLKCKYLKE